MPKPDGQQIRKAVLEAVQAYAGTQLQNRTVLAHVRKTLGIAEDREVEQAVLTYFHDLFRSGQLAWGYNLSNPDPPFMHLTAAGRRALTHLSRDPMNYDGYMAFIGPNLASEPLALSYIDEAVRTYQTDCLKASAVMAGAAVESLVLGLRDVVVARYQGQPAPPDLTNWMAKTVRDGLTQQLDKRKGQMLRPLRERFEGHWQSGSEAFRIARNDAGHPKSVAPVTEEWVHASLLLFPEFASLVVELKTWAGASYAP